METLAKDLADDAHYVEGMGGAVRGDSNEEILLREGEIDALTTGAPWIILFQRLNPDNDTTRQLEKLQFPIGWEGGQLGAGSIFEEIPFWRKPRALSRRDLGHRLPPALASLVAEHFAIVAINTAKGLRSLLILDRHLEEDPRITEADLAELDWFARQASLAVENAENRNDLANAYNELKQFDQMKSNFLSVISHELRTPLTAMSGFVDLIVDERVGPINENQRTLLTRVQKNTGHLIHLVNDLIEVAEIEAEGTVEVRVSPVEPLTVLLDTLPRLEQRRREKNVKVEPLIQCEIPRILADERALGRIFFHLIDNAIKFSFEGSSVDVVFHVVDGEFHADIIDRGMGIAPENKKRIFDHFYQVDSTLTRGHEGLGLGLAVIKLLLAATRGRIAVKSEVGTGSTFTVIFPLVETRDSRVSQG